MSRRRFPAASGGPTPWSLDDRPEVSCRNTEPVFAYLDKIGHAPAEVFADTDLDLGRLRERSEWISWRDFNVFLDAVVARIGEDGMRQLGHDILETPALGLFSVVAARTTDVPATVRWMARMALGPGGQLFRGIDYDVLVHSDEEITVRVDARSERRLPRGMALGFAGSLERIALLLGAPAATGAIEWSPEQFEIGLQVSPYRSLGKRLARTWRQLLPTDLMAHEVRATNERLVAANQRLERQLAALHEAERERTALERRLNEAERLEAIGRFSGGIAHDFNNLLTVMITCSELAMRAVRRGADPTRHIEATRETARKAAQLTEQLLAFGRREPQTAQIVDVEQLIADSRGMLETLLGDERALRMNLEAGGAFVRSDPTQLEQVLVNLTANARDAMPDGGTLTISTRRVLFSETTELPHPDLRPAEYVAVSVHDCGEGMAPDVLEHVFEPFFTTKGPGSGTGLGLATVYGIVSQSGGAIIAESTPGSGTTFCAYLPVA